MKPATYKVIRFRTDRGNRFVAIAWNYAEALFISVSDMAAPDEAVGALELECHKRGVELKWFDGSYVFDGKNEQIYSESSADCINGLFRAPPRVTT